MSIPFAKSVRALLLADSSVSAALPGGITPDKIPEGASLPAADYTVQSEPFTSISGPVPSLRSCSLELRVIAETVAQLETAQSAIETVIGDNPGRVAQAGQATVHSLALGQAVQSAEDFSDGSDEPLRILNLTITGWVTQ